MADQSGIVRDKSSHFTSAQSPLASNILGHQLAIDRVFRNFSSALIPHSNSSGYRISQEWRNASNNPISEKNAIKPQYICRLKPPDLWIKAKRAVNPTNQ